MIKKLNDIEMSMIVCQKLSHYNTVINRFE